MISCSYGDINLCAAVVTLDVITATRYYEAMIQSFGDKDTEKLARLERVSRFVQFERIALRKLAQLDVAERLEDLRVSPGNRLEQLKGDREGQHSTRINDQYRICFSWTEQGPKDVEVCDYH
jgi:proteic killer suppression protein